MPHHLIANSESELSEPSPDYLAPPLGYGVLEPVVRVSDAHPRLLLLLDTMRFTSEHIAFVAEVSVRTVQRYLRAKYPDSEGDWRLTGKEMLEVVRALESAQSEDVSFSQ